MKQQTYHHRFRNSWPLGTECTSKKIRSSSSKLEHKQNLVRGLNLILNKGCCNRDKKLRSKPLTKCRKLSLYKNKKFRMKHSRKCK